MHDRTRQDRQDRKKGNVGELLFMPIQEPI